MILDLFLIAVLLLLGFYWSTSLKAREIAFTAAAAHCHKLQVQLLDGCVVLDGFWLRKHHGKWLSWRSYQFEFSANGEDRQLGKIVMLDNKIINIQPQIPTE